MPRVPTYDNFTVSPTTLPGARVDTPRVADVGRQLQETGQAVMSAGRAAATIATDIQNEANKLRVDDAYTQLQTSALELEMGQEGFIKLKGNDALSRPDGKPLDVEYGEKLDSNITKLRDGLGNDAQKAMFDRYANDTRLRFKQRVDAHTLNEFQVYNQGVQDGKIKTGVQTMSLNWNDPVAVSSSRQAVREAVAAKYKGQSPELIEAQTISALTPGHSSVIAQAMQNNNFAFARDYLKTHSGEISADARLQLEKAIQINETQVTGESAARDVIAGAGPDWTLKSIDDQLVQKYGGDPKTLEAARREAKYQYDLRNDGKKQAEIQLLKPVQDVIGTAVLRGQVISRSDAEALLAPLRNTAPDLYVQAANSIDAHNDEIRGERNAADELARRRHKEAVELGLKGDEVSTATWYTLKTNPAALRTADLFDLRKQGLIGQKHFNDLAGDQQKLREGKVEENTILSDKAAVDIVLKEAKITVDGKNVTGSDAANLALFYQAYNDRVNAAGGSKTLTQNQKTEIARGLLKEVKVERKYWFDTSKRAFKLTIDDVPGADRRQIESALRASNMPVTNQNILRMYQMGQ